MKNQWFQDPRIVICVVASGVLLAFMVWNSPYAMRVAWQAYRNWKYEKTAAREAEIRDKITRLTDAAFTINQLSTIRFPTDTDKARMRIAIEEYISLVEAPEAKQSAATLLKRYEAGNTTSEFDHTVFTHDFEHIEGLIYE